MQKRFALVLTLGSLSLVMACASVPSFKPSKPVDQAKSLQEGLLLCSEYRLPPDPKRPVTLRPFLDCLDELNSHFPAATRGNGGFNTFRDEFHRSYWVLKDDGWKPQLGVELEVAVHAVLRALWQSERPTVTPLERDLVLKNFPATSQQLDATHWLVASGATFDPKLESLKAGVASLGEGELAENQASSLTSEQTPSVALLCKEYLHLKRETTYLGNLWRDQFDFSMLAPQSPVSAAVRDKYSQRLNNALRDLEVLRPEIVEARVKESFRVLACLH